MTSEGSEISNSSSLIVFLASGLTLMSEVAKIGNSSPLIITLPRGPQWRVLK